MMTLASGAAIALRQGELMVCRARAGTTAPDLGAELDIKSGLSGECVRTAKMLLCEDTENDLRVNLDVCRYLGIRSIAVLPICLDQQVVGVFEVFSAHPGAFASNELAALDSMCELVVSVIRPAPQAQPPAQAAVVAALATRAAECKREEAPAVSVAVWDPGDDLMCEIEQPPEAARKIDPALRAMELINTGHSPQVGGPEPAPSERVDPDDDLICEIEMRAGLKRRPFEKELSAFAPAPTRAPERAISRKLIVVGVVAAGLGLTWLGWCNRAQQQVRNPAPPAVMANTESAPAPAEAPPATVMTAPGSSETAQGEPAGALPAIAPTPSDAGPNAVEPPPADAGTDSAELSTEAAKPSPEPASKLHPPRRVPAPRSTQARLSTRREKQGRDLRKAAAVRENVHKNRAVPPSSEVAHALPFPDRSQSISRPPDNMGAGTAPLAAAKPAQLPSPSAQSSPATPPIASASAGGRLSLSQAVVTVDPAAGRAENLSQDAIRLLRASAQAGDANAQLALAVRYTNGDGVRQSYPEALKWFTRARAQGVTVPEGGQAAAAWNKVQQWEQSQQAKR